MDTNTNLNRKKVASSEVKNILLAGQALKHIFIDDLENHQGT